ncbi:1574_t:CDS:2, partial [Entrophospora sp. SA101]
LSCQSIIRKSYTELSENLVCKEISRVNNRIDKELEVGKTLLLLACNLRCIAHFVNLAIKSIIEQYKLIVEAAHEIWK